MNKIIIALLIFFTSSALWAQPIRLVFWHAMAGSLGQEVKSLANEFNKSQNEYVIEPVYKGDYIETLTSFAAAFRAHKAPNIVQIFEVGTAIMLSPPGVIKPVEELMQEQRLRLPEKDFIQSVRQFYSRDGKLMAMPFNLSVPVIFYNADLLAKLGYTSSNFPKTWDQMEVLAKRIKTAGYSCAYTTAYPGWVLFESYMAINGLPITSAKDPFKVAYETPALERHFQRLQNWHQLGYFRYGGRVDEATIFFTSGVCPLFSQSSGAYNSLASLVPFHIGVAALPLDTKVSAIRHANVAGGGALWVVSGQTPEQYRGIAEFFVFLAQAKIQKQWHEHTGYIPIGLTGIYSEIIAQSKQPILQLAQKDLNDAQQAASLKYLGPQNQIRSINDEVLEGLFAGLLNANQAMHESVRRSDQILMRFKKNSMGH
ncbi:MAG: extracellular solute-binding protein [Legionella sp.]|jgi:sn-glycerol 3-phosphate transport system substrate-binding protein